MTDRISYLTVALEREMRVDDAEYLINAIRMLKGVAKVEQGIPADMNQYLATQRVGQMVSEILDNLSSDLRHGRDPRSETNG